MLSNKMTLKEMIDYKPDEVTMEKLPLNVVLYIKISVVSYSKKDNYDFINFLFTQDEINDFIFNIKDSIVYDFDGTVTKQERFVSIMQVFGLKNFEQTSIYLQEIMQKYDHTADILIDIYTHDDKEYRLSNLDGIVKLEQMNIK